MDNVVVLAHDEEVRIDGRALAVLQAQLGSAGAEGVISRAVEEIANRLSLIERAHAQRERDALWKTSKGLIGIAEQIGLVDLARVSRDVSQCARGRDDVALSAVLARLIRLGDRSVTTVWGMADISNF
ncbi:MAG: hypothetical protein AAGF13_08755 [Pseudomonadota bacterium]